MSRKSGKQAPDAAPADEAVRVDKWLWAARFFKTRSLASTAVKGGRIEVNGHNAKPSTNVRPGLCLRISKGDTVFEVDVLEVSEQRGPANVAQALYTETPASVERRQAQAAERKTARAAMPRTIGRPDKKQRRQLRQFKQGD